MVQAILFAYVVIKWVGAWSIFEGTASVCFSAGLCIFAAASYVGSLLSRGTLASVAALIDDAGGYGLIITPILWILFFILYPLGLVDWLVFLHALKSNQGYLFSHQSPTTFDIIALILLVILFAMPFIRFWRFARRTE